MKGSGRAWKIGVRTVVGVVLLVWIVHSIFVHEARLSARAGKLHDLHGVPVQWDSLARPEQWRYGWEYGPPALWATLKSVGPGCFTLSLVLMGSTLILGVMRWRMALQVQGIDLSFGRATEISLVAHFFNSFLLGTAGGDLMKAWYAARETQHKKTEAIVTVFVDRLIGLWAMLLFAAILVPVNFRLFQQSGLRTVTALVMLMMVAMSIFAFLAFRGGISKAWSGARRWLRRLPKGEWLEKSVDSCRNFGRARGFVARALALSMLLNSACVLQFWVLARGLEINVSLMVLALAVPMVIFTAALIAIAPGGVGVRESAFVYLLAVPVIGVPATLSLSLSLLAFAGSLFWGLVGGVVYITLKERHHLREAELEKA